MKINLQTLIFTISTTLAILALPSCQKSETNNLQDAQLCLNTATPENARACLTSIESDKTAFADSLRCSAIFIAEGFGSPADLYDALQGMNPDSSSCTTSCSSTIGALVTFSFKSAGVSTPAERDANSATAAEAFTVCSQSDVKFYAQISSLFKIGTLATMAVGVATPTPDQIQSIITSLDAGTLGELVTTSYESVCSGDMTDAPDSTVSYCSELSTALASNNSNVDIGNCLKHILETGESSCP